MIDSGKEKIYCAAYETEASKQKLKQIEDYEVIKLEKLLEKLDNVTDIEIKQKALSFATRDAGQVWQVLQENGCTIEEIEVRNRTLLDSIFETTQE